MLCSKLDNVVLCYRQVIESYGDQIVFIQQPDLSDPVLPEKEKKFKGYFKIARHYGWALNHTFMNLGFDQVDHSVWKLVMFNVSHFTLSSFVIVFRFQLCIYCIKKIFKLLCFVGDNSRG